MVAPCALEVIEGFHAEPWVALDPRNPDVGLVATFGSVGEWGSWVYLAATSDGGKTWTAGRAPLVSDDALAPADAPGVFPLREGPVFADHRAIAADPMAVFTEEGDALVVALVGRNTYAASPAAAASARPSDIVMWRSTDGGATFGPGEVIVPAEGAVAFTSAGRVDAHRWHDKPFLLRDAATGELHLFWNDVFSASPRVELLVSHSADGGHTWTPPALVAPGLYGVNAAAHNGTLLATARNPGYQLLRSADAGRSWEALGLVGEWPGPTSTWQAAPVALWQNASTLEALLVRAEGPEGERVLLQRSIDLGTTWSEPVDLMPPNKSARRNPVLALDAWTGNGFVASYQGTAADAAQLETWLQPLEAGGPRGAAYPVSGRAARSEMAFEYFGGAAGPSGGLVAYASGSENDAPLHAVPLRWT